MTRLAGDLIDHPTHVRTSLLSDAMLARFAERAPRYDAENRFAAEDFEELRQCGYLLLNVPTELGGHGRNLAEVAREQRRLAYHAAPTALAVNMHRSRLAHSASSCGMRSGSAERPSWSSITGLLPARRL